MSQLTRHDYASTLALVAELEREEGVARIDLALARLRSFVACETVELGVLPSPTAEPGVLRVPLRPGEPAVAVVLRRRHSAFSRRDRERLELLRPHLAYLCSHALAQEPPVHAASAGDESTRPPAPIRMRHLTPRECDVMRWVACGKTDAEIAALLAISVRTVNKHLEHVYEKLGVETRTAAVMALASAAESHETS